MAALPLPNPNARAVIVTRRTQFEQLLQRHGTIGQAEFFLRSRGDSIKPYIQAHQRVQEARKHIETSLPAQLRRAEVDRDELDRFLFAPDDVVITIGQDGLVANVAKYLKGQPVAAINPDPQRYDGVLCRLQPATFPVAARLLFVASHATNASTSFKLQKRSLVEAIQSDGQKILALNEVFVGHASHQSARYRITTSNNSERQSSSGIICSTGTGCTGWARSIVEQRGIEREMPEPEDRALAWFVREPFPSVATKTSLNFGYVEEGTTLSITSEMSEGGVIFGDGIETDRIDFSAGNSVNINVAEQTLNLIVPA